MNEPAASDYIHQTVKYGQEATLGLEGLSGKKNPYRKALEETPGEN